MLLYASLALADVQFDHCCSVAITCLQQRACCCLGVPLSQPACFITLKSTLLVKEMQHAVLQGTVNKLPAAVAVQPAQTLPM